MKNLITHPKNWLHPIALLSYTGATIIFLSPYFGLTTRWVFTIILSIFLFFQFRYVGLFSINFSKIVLLNLLWCAATVIWSQVPLLSFLKVGALLLVVFTFYYASQAWIMRHYIDQALDFFWLSVLFSILAAIFGLGSSGSVIYTGGGTLYQGMVSGPNMLGALLLMSVPLLAWRTYCYWSSGIQRFFWFGLLIIVFIFLFMANSRASLAGALFCIISFIYSLGSNKWIPLITTLIFSVSIFVITFPTVFDDTVNKFIYKSSSKELGIFHTRKSPWEESIQQAKLGGWFGGGYGVTIGDNIFEGGVSAEGYGREKGNTPLAIIEEIGIVGLILYLILLGSLYRHLFRAYGLCRHNKLKVLLGILIGAISGMIFHSMFEAWWVAPGSPEFVYFWTLVGAAVGISRLIEMHLKSLNKERNDAVL